MYSLRRCPTACIGILISRPGLLLRLSLRKRFFYISQIQIYFNYVINLFARNRVGSEVHIAAHPDYHTDWEISVQEASC